MDVGTVCERVRGVAAVRACAVADRSALEGGLRSVAVVRSWLSAVEADLAARLAGVASFPEQAIAEAGRGSQSEASRVLERSATLGAVPALAGALNDGSVTAGHVDVVTKVAKGLDGAQREALLERADRLVGIARHGTVTDFRKRLEREAEVLRADDGTARFERQQRASRLRRWTDADGMWCLQGRFDPLTGVRLNARLTAEIEAAFAESVPEGCPTDPQAKNEFLAACALARILQDGGVAQRAGRPEFVVVIEADSEDADDSGGSSGSRSNSPKAVAADGGHGGGRVGDADGGEGDGADGGYGDSADGSDGHGDGAPHSGGGPGIGRRPRVDWGLPVEIPYSVLIELFADADVYPVIVRNGVVLYAPGELDLGRTTRLANRAQRRALRALYPSCAIPGCEARFERCKIHHVHWWRHGGRTDLENLLPLCVHHHKKVHNQDWVITLGRGRILTLRLPDGSVHNTGPPRRSAA